MAFTTSVITHTFLNADSTPSAGEISFTLENAMTNGGVTIAPSSHVTASIAADGTISQTLTSTQDPDTVPQEPMPLWRVDERIAGASVRTYSIQVPSGGGTVDLGTLMPFAAPAGPGGQN